MAYPNTTNERTYTAASRLINTAKLTGGMTEEQAANALQAVQAILEQAPAALVVHIWRDGVLPVAAGPDDLNLAYFHANGLPAELRPPVDEEAEVEEGLTLSARTSRRPRK